MTETTMIQTISVERLQALFQSMGYRVTVSEHGGMRQLLSASQGIGFSVRPGNPAQAEGEFIDYTLSCPLQVQGELPADLTENWNIDKRFARLTRQSGFLVMEMDVVVAGGVGEAYLRATIELWDRLLQELILFLRDYASAQQQPGAGEAAHAETNVAAAAAEELAQ
ncbi:YbjN domain-containing protein [Chromobacterium sp. IIBBL 290-4]|uniref:YbjN domain-containing protein n=1 Tax=Chromobacterium sp. IIBBL 290-4 TaxID=2953890 RepID=UPI0020B81C5F|nr:YbjN domain-containing protein [Chromobacterium sp. IIBBL 290-4]UTH74484.1 YbjN domain-containing protein [Chromobacterium sp. IIBBL 290-4]